MGAILWEVERGGGAGAGFYREITLYFVNVLI